MSAIDHPSHYNVGKIEVIDYIEDQGLGFNLGNAIKYVSRAGLKGKAVEDLGRAGLKGKAIEDLEKAKWYISREIGKLEGG